jgi:hypothetical protein
MLDIKLALIYHSLDRGYKSFLFRIGNPKLQFVRRIPVTRKISSELEGRIFERYTPDFLCEYLTSKLKDVPFGYLSRYEFISNFFQSEAVRGRL